MGSLNSKRIASYRRDECKTLGDYVKAIDERLKVLEERTKRSGYTREDFYKDHESGFKLRPYYDTKYKDTK